MQFASVGAHPNKEAENDSFTVQLITLKSHDTYILSYLLWPVLLWWKLIMLYRILAKF